MTLTPETRVLLTDALRPPAGYRVEVAVGTTYSLNLTALLLAPLSFALFDQGNSEEIGAVDPIRLLEAVRRYADHTTMFCQAGGIHVPSKYPSILTFLEDSVQEVIPPRIGRTFHPKIWAIRFIDQDGSQRHRVIILSRNMTFDRSWDTALALDEDVNGTIDAAPAAQFVAKLGTLARPRLDDTRIADLESLQFTLGQISLAAPAPFTSGELVPMGMGDESVWPFPDQGKRILAISPFLTGSVIRKFSKVAKDRLIVSRAESLELVGAKMLDRWKVNVLQPLAELHLESDLEDAPTVTDRFRESNDGLHAKTFVIDLQGGQSTIVTGSANLTSAAWGGNVEFDAVLTGPTSLCGVNAILNGSKDVPGLLQILQEYSIQNEEVTEDAAIEAAYVLEQFHLQLATNELELHIAEVDAERVSATLSVTVPADAPGETRVWLASLSSEGQSRTLGSELAWTIAPANITPFIAFETTCGDGQHKVARRCVLKARLTGAIDGRRQDAVFSILRSKEDVLRYLVFLLGDPSYDALFAQLAGLEAESFADSGRPLLTSEDVALFEPLVRATGRDEDALARVASLVQDLRALPNGDELVPDGFEELWDVVWQVHQEHRT